MAYSDVVDPVAMLNRAPEGHTGPQVADAIANAGFEVQAVNWVWQKIVGESLVDSIIKPITGDFDKIAEQAGQWKNVSAALQAVRNNVNAGLGELQGAWTGDAADKFRNLIGQTWTLGIEADAQAANLIGFALNKVAQGSRRACDQILHLIKMLVDKLIEAAAMLPIPVVGWGRAVKLVYDGIQIYNAIMQLIEGIRAIIQGAQQVIDGIQQVGTALSKIKDIHNLNDALNVANEAGQGIVTTAQGARQVQYGATQAASAAGDLAHSAASAHDNATGLRDERAAAAQTTTPSGTTTGPGSGTTTRGTPTETGTTTNRPDNPRDTASPVNGRRCQNDPIDVASGEMVLHQVDVELDGVLPLVLTRTHISSYRSGRAFGRSWASTVDQRLEIDADGVVFVAEDGMILVYPRPDGAAPVLPQEGPRWPLRRTESGYAITRSESRQTLHFASTPGAVSRLASMTDHNGNRIDVLRDQDGQPTEVRHSGGYRIGVHTEAGQITTLRLLGQDGTGDVVLVRYRYDEAGRLTEVVNSSGLPLRFGYDSAGRIVRWEDRNGQWYSYAYDDDGRCVRNAGSGGFLAGGFDYQDRLTIFTDSLGHETRFHLNDAGQVTREIDPLGNTTVFEWDRYDRPLSRTDPLGRTTRYTYDEDGNVVTLVRPDGRAVTATYNALGLPVTVTDPDGTVWRREYDERGNLVAITDPAGATTRCVYTASGHLAAVTDPVGGTRRFDTDPAGLPVAVTDPLGATTRYVRDVFGRIAHIVDPVGGVDRLTWTVEGKLLSRTRPDGATERWRYDGEGNQLEHVDAVGRVNRTEYTGFDLPAARTDPGGARYEFGYDSQLRLVSVTNPQRKVWRYTYDPAGRLVSETDFNDRTLRYVHDAAGQLTERTNGAGETVRYAYDALGGVTEKTAADGVTRFGYDAAGHLIQASGPDAEVSIRRDPLGRILAESVNGRVVSSVYDPAGRRIRRTTPSGAESVWDYDANSQPTALHTAGHTLRFAYDPARREIRRELGAGAVLTQAWDASHRLTSQTVTGPDPYAPPDARQMRLVQQRAYQYRPDGHLIGVTDQLSGSRRFELDPAGRVTAVHGAGWTERYAYDQAGNITAAAWPIPAGVPDLEAQGEREHTGTVIRRAGNVHYRHDPQGRVVSRQHRTLSGKTLIWRYTWDSEDRLTGVVTPDGARWRYRYDPLGRRVAKLRLTDDGSGVAEQVDFTWDKLVLAEQTRSGGPTTTWNWDTDTFRPVTQTERAPLRDAPQEWVDQQFYALVTDLVGTPTEMVDPDGDIAWHSRTTLWGAAVAGLGDGPQCPLRFPGQYYDAETGLHYNYHRYYEPLSGRFANNDPLGLSPAPNPQAYVSNPTGETDPLGLTPCVPLYRGMKNDGGVPEIGPSARTLGARPGTDIPVDSNGMVHPGSGGVSVSPHSPTNLPQHRRPPEFGGTGRDPVWRIGSANLPEGLTYRPDPHNPGGHGFIEPSRPMSISEYQNLLASSQGTWSLVTP
jgi:RHS repeat-associated protein